MTALGHWLLQKLKYNCKHLTLCYHHCLVQNIGARIWSSTVQNLLTRSQKYFDATKWQCGNFITVINLAEGYKNQLAIAK